MGSCQFDAQGAQTRRSFSVLLLQRIQRSGSFRAAQAQQTKQVVIFFRVVRSFNELVNVIQHRFKEGMF